MGGFLEKHSSIIVFVLKRRTKGIGRKNIFFKEVIEKHLCKVWLPETLHRGRIRTHGLLIFQPDSMTIRCNPLALMDQGSNRLNIDRNRRLKL
jgi:hypothetical protein